ncbi:MAG: ABC transporter ATP-binding protein, partial [Bacteroidota bacterium]
MYIEDTDFQKKRALWPFLRRIFTLAFQYKQWVVILVLGALVTAAADAAIPWMWRQYIDTWITPVVETYSETGETQTSGFWWFGAGFISIFIVEGLAIAAFIYAAGRLQEYVIFDLRNQMFRKLQRLPYAFYDKSAIGHLAIRLTSDVNKVARVISWGIVDLLFGVFMIFVSMTTMLFLNWKLSLSVILVIPVLLFLAVRVRLLLLGYARKARKTYSQMAAYMTEHINGVEVNKTTVQEARSAEGFEEVTETFRHSVYKASYFSALYNPIVVFTGSIAAALVIYFGGHLALTTETGITIGTLAAFFLYSVMIFEPIFDITRYYAMAQDSLSAGERIFSLIDEPVAIKDIGAVDNFGKIRGDIEFVDMDFHYKEDKSIFQDFHLHIPAGQSVALVGTTGSGKTTLSSLIARFYEPVKGELQIDGIDYRQRSLESYRAQLGVILQTPHLFSGTLRENLAYGKLDATDEEIQSALSLIGLEGFGDRLDEQVGEEGNNFSAGERQLISFARALLKDPAILIMDEATSSVDTLAELQVQQGINRMIEDRTAIVVAHRLSTIAHLDRIIVLDE